MRGGDHLVEIGKAAEHRVHVPILGHVIAEILHRRGEERADPDRVGAEAGDMRQAADDAQKVTDAVAIRVLKTAGVDLIDHRTPPPVRVFPEVHLSHLSPSRPAGRARDIFAIRRKPAAASRSTRRPRPPGSPIPPRASRGVRAARRSSPADPARCRGKRSPQADRSTPRGTGRWQNSPMLEKTGAARCGGRSRTRSRHRRGRSR